MSNIKVSLSNQQKLKKLLRRDATGGTETDQNRNHALAGNFMEQSEGVSGYDSVVYKSFNGGKPEPKSSAKAQLDE